MASVPADRARARVIARELSARPRSLADRALALLASKEQLAYELLRASKGAVLSLSRAEIAGMLRTLHDWKSTDCFGCFVSGVAWREGTISDREIMAWASSSTVWTRRAALVSTVPLNLCARGATAPKGEAARTLAVCEALLDDREDMIVKALSWALRTLATRDARAVRAFLDEHDGRVAPRALRETRSKLTTGRKNPRKKGE